MDPRRGHRRSRGNLGVIPAIDTDETVHVFMPALVEAGHSEPKIRKQKQESMDGKTHGRGCGQAKAC